MSVVAYVLIASLLIAMAGIIVLSPILVLRMIAGVWRRYRGAGGETGIGRVARDTGGRRLCFDEDACTIVVARPSLRGGWSGGCPRRIPMQLPCPRELVSFLRNEQDLIDGYVDRFGLPVATDAPLQDFVDLVNRQLRRTGVRVGWLRRAPRLSSRQVRDRILSRHVEREWQAMSPWLESTFDQWRAMPDQAIVKFFAYAAVETLGDDWASAAPHLEWFAVSRGVAIDVKRFKKEASRLHTDRVDHTLMQTLRAHSRGTAFDLDDVDSMDPYDFEEFVSNLYAAQGYRTAPTQRSGDQGADVLLERLGAQTAVQVKLYSGPVGNKAVQEAIAAREFYGCSDATVVTNSTYTRSAQELAARCRVTLVDREDLQDMIDCYNAGSAVDRATAEHRPPRRHPPREAQLPTQG